MNYTETQGVCSVTGIAEFDSDADAEKAAAKYAELIKAKFDGVPPSVESGSIFAWKPGLPRGFNAVMVKGDGDGFVGVLFRFANYDDCEAEEWAAKQAEFDARFQVDPGEF